MAAVTIPMDATDEEEARIKEEAYTRHLAAERAEADREINAEYAASHAATVIAPPRSAREARDTRREAKEGSASRPRDHGGALAARLPLCAFSGGHRAL